MSLYISLSGLIGVGKSTLAKALAEEMGLDVYYEPVDDNPYLSLFYSDMKQYSFPMQMFLLNKRFKQQQQIIWSGKGAVQDRTIYEDSIFAKMLNNTGMMSDLDYQTYREMFDNISNFMKHPHFIIHLEVTPEESYRRIQERSRGCESSITVEYLHALNDAYEEFLKDISKKIPIIRVKYEKFRSAKELAVSLKQKYLELTTVVELDN